MMAVRLNVLVLSPSGSSAGFQQQCDDVIGQLLGRPGLDVTLLERLPKTDNQAADDHSTERLALESLGGHLACLAWSEPSEFQTEMNSAGKPLNRRPHQHDPEAGEATPERSMNSVAGAGRMFYFDMRQAGISEVIFASLQELLKKLQTPMFQIQPAGHAKGDKFTLAPGGASEARGGVHAGSNARPSRSEANRPSLGEGEGKPADSKSTTQDVSPTKDDDLDRLVDELDEMNL